MPDRTRPRTNGGGVQSQINELRHALVGDSPGQPQWERTSAILDRFAQFASYGFGATSLNDICPEIARSFIEATTALGKPPSVSTRHWRRTALRLLFRAARDAGLVAGDPTLDLDLPPRSSLGTRPLIDDEVALCRSVAQWSLAGSRRAAVWALAEATCRSSELPNISADDIDLDSGRVWISGGKATEPREGDLTDWGLQHVRARILELDEPTQPLVYSGRSPSGAGQVAGASALVDVLIRAGLHQEPDVRPGSVAAWAGRRVLDETGRIDLAAKALGVRSLDRAAGIIGWDWHGDAEADST
jgi:integrase